MGSTTMSPALNDAANMFGSLNSLINAPTTPVSGNTQAGLNVVNRTTSDGDARMSNDLQRSESLNAFTDKFGAVAYEGKVKAMGWKLLNKCLDNIDKAIG